MGLSSRALGERGSIVLLCYVNFLIFLNRGIIPGAPESFQTFITKSLGASVTRQNFYMGLLQTAYVSAVAVSSLVFGYLALRYKPFRLISCGMIAWVIGAMVSGIAYFTTSYSLLVVGRILTGLGEASFQCNAMPFINRHAPKKNSTLWLALFIASVTVGMAVGYVYGSALAASPLTWAGAFFVEGGLMVPAIAASLICIPEELDAVPVDSLGDIASGLLHGEGTQKTPLVRSLVAIFTSIPFLLVALGYAAYTFVLGCFSTFAPSMLIGFGFFDNEGDVSLMFGGITLVSGTVGAILGGLALDRITSGNSVSQRQRSKLAVDMLVVLIFLTTAAAIAMPLCENSKTGFLAWLCVTYFFASVLGPAETVAVMELVPVSQQPLAVAANTAVLLVFGDVPSPVVLGWLKDSWAPRCGTIELDGKSKLNPDCALDRSGLHDVLLFAVLWLVWAVLLWVVAKFVIRKQKSEKQIEFIASPAIQTN